MSTLESHPSLVHPEAKALGPWFHNLHLPDGTQTCPNHWLGDFPSFKWEQLGPHLPRDLSGWSCLDIGCNAGFYTFELAKRGATVLGIDLDDRYLRQAKWAATQFGMQDHVHFERMQVYELARRNERFDLILFMGVLYHLRYPMLGMDIIAQKVKRLLVFQTLEMPGDEIFNAAADYDWKDRHLLRDAGWPKAAFLEHRFVGDPTNWWVLNKACSQAMLRSAGMKITGSPGHEIYLCEPDADRPSCMTTWNAGEFLAATGTAATASDA